MNDRSSNPISKDESGEPESEVNSIEVNEDIRSLWAFGVDHPLRQGCISILRSSTFETAVLALILVSTVCLIVDEPWLERCEVSESIV